MTGDPLSSGALPASTDEGTKSQGAPGRQEGGVAASHSKVHQQTKAGTRGWLVQEYMVSHPV